MLFAILAMLAGGCSAGQDTPKKTLTERQRDSVLSKSVLPNAGMVGRAMAVSDAEARRASRMDAVVDSLPH
jgi:hypothetical protein